MTEEKQLTLEEMLLLAEKVENWEEKQHSVYGLLGDIEINITCPFPQIISTACYEIQAEYKSKKIILGSKIGREGTNEGRNIGKIYKKAIKKIEEKNALKYARSLLDK